MLNRSWLWIAIACGISQLYLVGSTLAGPNHELVVKQVSKAFRDHYIFPEVAEKMVKKLENQLKAGVYQKISDPMLLAQQLTKDLYSISKDKHIRIFYAETKPQPELSPKVREKLRQEMQGTNYEFKRLEILDGNIGYLKLNGFAPAELGGSAAVAAMSFLSNTDALIIDLRHNGGGSPSMIQLLSSYFFDKPVHLNSFDIRHADQPQQFWTHAHVQEPRYLNKDIYILTSKRTFSAAEEFCYNLKHLKRAKLVGETTGGGANPVNGYYLEDVKLMAIIPFGRAINPITKTNWEGVGVKPHISVKADEALDRAHALALDTLIQSSTDRDKLDFWRWSQEAMIAKKQPLLLSQTKKKEYVGTFGERKVFIEGSNLYYQRGDLISQLIPVSNDRFILKGVDQVRIQFGRDKRGRIESIIGIYQRKEQEKFMRTE